MAFPNLVFGPPSLWLTINPSDIHDPIAQVLTGADIDLDAFVNRGQPDGKEHANRIANDPYAAATFFHFIIKTAGNPIWNESHSIPSQVRNGCIRRARSIFWSCRMSGTGRNEERRIEMIVHLLKRPNS